MNFKNETIAQFCRKKLNRPSHKNLAIAIKCVRFKPTRFRSGYDIDEVDDFLDELADHLERLRPSYKVYAELNKYKRENEELKKKLEKKRKGRK
jgi:DivIVA domain-containing protein